MNKFSDSSLKRLGTCHPKLCALFLKVLKAHDCVIVCGHRNQEDQDKAYFDGKSKLRWPHSKHNSIPSMAVDVVPYDSVKKEPIWDNVKSLYFFAGIVKGIAQEMGVKVRFGGDWDGDNNFNQSFDDLVHWELME